MGSLRTILVLIFMAGPTWATPDDLVSHVARCTGRMSAEMEFAWLLGQSGEQERLFRTHLEDVLEAIADPDAGRDILNMRIEAKHAQATLLTRSLFNVDADDAARAARLAAGFAQTCRAMLTG